MAQVPYTPVPNVQEEDPRLRLPHVDTPGAAFGTNIAGAIEKGGQTLGQVGNELFQRAMGIQDLVNENRARETSIAATQEMAVTHEKFDSLEGKARSDALIPHLKELNDIRLKYRQGLSDSPMAQRMFDFEAASLQNRFTAQSAARAGQGLKEYTVQNAQAQVDLTKRQWVDPFSESEYNSKVENVKAGLRTQAGTMNWSDAVYQDHLLKETSDLRTSQILTQKDKDPQRAFASLEKAVDTKEITQQQYRAAWEQVAAANRRIGSQNIADSVYNINKPMDQAVDEAKKMAGPLAHDDAEFEKHVTQAVRAKYSYDDFITRRQMQDDIKSVTQAIGTDQFQSRQEMYANSELKPIMDRLAQSNPKYLDGLDKTIESHFTIEHKQQNDSNYHYLYEMAYKNPQKFLEQDVLSFQMSDAQQRQIMSVRHQISADPNGDPRVSQAMKWLQASRGGDLRALGIHDKPDKNTDNPDWGAYIAALQGGIEAWTEEKGRPPGRQDIVDSIGPAAIKSVGVPRFGGFFITHPQAVPQDTLDDAKAELMKKAKAFGQEIEPSDQEVLSEVRRQQFKALYSKSKPSGGSTGSSTPISQ